MTTQAIQRHKQLPLDVLYVVFSCYAEDETPANPVETLLLVCRLWNWIALRNREMWSKFNIYLDSFATAEYWVHQIPLRLEKSGPNRIA